MGNGVKRVQPEDAFPAFPAEKARKPSSELRGTADKLKKVIAERTIEVPLRSGIGHKLSAPIAQISEHSIEWSITSQSQTILSSGTKIIESHRPPILPEESVTMVSSGFKVCGVAISSLNTLVRGAALKEAVAKLHAIFVWGGLFDKIEGVLQFLISLTAFASAAVGTISTVAGVAVSVVLALPLLFIKLLLQVCVAIHGIVIALRINRNLSKLNLLLENPTRNKEKLQDVLNFIGGINNSVLEENAKLTPEGRVLPENLKRYLVTRHSERLVQEFGASAQKDIFIEHDGKPYYKVVQEDLEKVSTELQAVREEINRGVDSSERISYLTLRLAELTKRESKLVAAGIEWALKVRENMQKGRDIYLPFALSSVAGLAALIFGLSVIPGIVLSGLILTIAASLLRLTFDIISLQKKYEITKNQQEWLANIVADELVNEARDAPNRKEFVASYGFETRLDESEDEFFKQFKRHLIARIYVEGGKGLLDRSLLEKLKELNEKDIAEIPEESLLKLRDEFNRIFDRFVRSAEKVKISKERPTWTLLEKIKGDSRLKELIADYSYKFQKQHKKIQREFSLLEVPEAL